MTLYCGIDLHANNSVVSVLDEQDPVRFEKRLPNDLELIKASLEPYREELLACVVESTYNGYWLVDGLMDDGFDVRLAHTGAIVQYSGIKYRNDESDARHLAHLLRLDILPEGHIMPKGQRGMRDLLRRRMLLVHQRTLHHLSLQSLMVRHTAQRLSTNQIKGLEPDDLKDRLPEPICVGGQVTWRAMRGLDQAIDRLAQAVRKLRQTRQDDPRLTRIPGVGKILGATIARETGPIDRFPGPGHYASDARGVNTEKVSNGKIKGRGNKKNGNQYLAWAFMEAAHDATIWSPEIKRFYQQRKAKRHILVAKKTVANQLARACYHRLSKKEAFDVQRAFR